MAETEPEYRGRDDFSRSIDEAYRVIRERMKNGGPGWSPKPHHLKIPYKYEGK